MRRHWKYLSYVLRHKWFVLLAGWRMRVPLHLLLLHDISKFLPVEWFPYARTFYSSSGESQYEPSDSFDLAWLHHQKANKHHWQYWLLSTDQPRNEFNMQSHDGGMTHSYIVRRGLANQNIVAIVYDASIEEWHNPAEELVKELEAVLINTPVALPMPHRYRKEMLADWIGAGRALGKPNTWEWYNSNKRNIQLHPETREWVENQLSLLENLYRTDHRWTGGFYPILPTDYDDEDATLNAEVFGGSLRAEWLKGVISEIRIGDDRWINASDPKLAINNNLQEGCTIYFNGDWVANFRHRDVIQVRLLEEKK